MSDTVNLEPLLLTRADVATLLAVPERSVAWLHRIGKLRGVSVARKLRWGRADVESYVESLATAEASA